MTASDNNRRAAIDLLVGFYGLRRRRGFCLPITKAAALALDRKKLAAFSALGGGFLQFPIGDRRCKRTRASVSNAGGNARPSLTNATLAASRLLHRRCLPRLARKVHWPPTEKSWPHFRPSAGTAAPSVAPARHNFANDLAVSIDGRLLNNLVEPSNLKQSAKSSTRTFYCTKFNNTNYWISNDSAVSKIGNTMHFSRTRDCWSHHRANEPLRPMTHANRFQ